MSSKTSTIARLGVLAACLVVAVALGSAILLPGQGGGPGAGVSPTLAPTTTPTASPISSLQALTRATYVACGVAQASADTCIRPGTYLLGPTVPRGLVDVPAGWFEWDPGAGSVGLLVDRSDIPNGSGWGILFMQIGDVARDPCQASAGTHPAAEVDTPEKLAQVMATWPGFNGTPPEIITMGGLTGIRTRLSSTETTSSCPSPVLWRTSAGTAIDAYPMIDAPGRSLGDGYPAEYRLVKVDGGVLAIRAMGSASTSPFERDQGVPNDPKRHEADLVTLQGILDSMRFEDTGS